MKHSDYYTHINNKEDWHHLKFMHFPVNMRLFLTSEEYRMLIQLQCNYVRRMCLSKTNEHKHPQGVSSADLGLAFNIIGLARNRGTENASCLIMINPEITQYGGQEIVANSSCSSLSIENKIPVVRSERIFVKYYTERGACTGAWFDKLSGSFIIQHLIDHNLGILISDK